MARSMLIKELRKYFFLLEVNCHALQSVEKIQKREGEFEEIAQELSSRQERWLGSREHSLLSQRTEVCFPALPLGASQLPLTLVPGNIMPCDLFGHTHDIHSHRHKKQIKS